MPESLFVRELREIAANVESGAAVRDFPCREAVDGDVALRRRGIGRLRVQNVLDHGAALYRKNDGPPMNRSSVRVSRKRRPGDEHMCRPSAALQQAPLCDARGPGSGSQKDRASGTVSGQVGRVFVGCIAVEDAKAQRRHEHHAPTDFNS